MEAVLQVEATRNPQQPCHIFSNEETAIRRNELSRKCKKKSTEMERNPQASSAQFFIKSAFKINEKLKSCYYSFCFSTLGDCRWFLH
jgi:hypothetical protein